MQKLRCYFEFYFQYFFCNKFKYYHPYNLVKKFTNFNILYSCWNISSMQNIEILINNTHLTTCYGRNDTFINFETTNGDISFSNDYYLTPSDRAKISGKSFLPVPDAK